MRKSVVSAAVMCTVEQTPVRSADIKRISKNVLTKGFYSVILSENLEDGGSCNDSVSTYHNVE